MRPSQIQITKLQHFTGHTGAVYAIAKGLDENTFFTGGGDGVIAEWNILEQLPAKGIAMVPGNIFSLTTISEYNLLICGDMKGGIYVIDLEAKKVIKNLQTGTASVFDLHFDLDAGKLFAACGDGHVHIWEGKDFTFKGSVSISHQSLRNISISPAKSKFAFAASDHQLYITDPALQIEHILAGHTNSVFCSTFTQDGNFLLSGSRDARLRIWDARDAFMPVLAIDAHMFTINDIKMKPDGKLFATAGRDKHIKIWDAASFDLLKVIDHEKFGGHINSVNKLFWSDSENCLISCGDDRAVMVWEIRIKNQESGT